MSLTEIYEFEVQQPCKFALLPPGSDIPDDCTLHVEYEEFTYVAWLPDENENKEGN